MKKEDAEELLRKYRSGKCSEREMEIVERWYLSFDKDEAGKIDFSDTRKLITLRDHMFQNINLDIDQAEQGLRQIRHLQKRDRKRVVASLDNWSRIAAVLLVGSGLGFFFYHQNSSGIKEENTMVEVVAPKEVSPSTIYLSDGSVVWLKGESILGYPESFTGGIREVTLIGEAFFDVAKNPAKPFIIHSAHFTTRVLGTSFNIKAYENDESQEIECVTGKVVVSVKESSGDKVKELILNPNQKAIYSKKDNSLVEFTAAEHTTYGSFSECKLAFDETPLENIIKVLNATYDVNISLADEGMKNCVITADLTNETLEISIAILSKAMNAEYTINEKDIILSGGSCAESTIQD